MTIISWKTNFIGLNVPSKVVAGNLPSGTSSNNIIINDYWQYPNTVQDSLNPNSLQYPTDYWYGYGPTPMPYRWIINAQITQQDHGSNITRIPKAYDGMDIEVGDYVADLDTGKVLQVIQVLSKSSTNISCVAEDTLRYNTFNNGSGNGVFANEGGIVFFQINELGVPMTNPIPPGAGTVFVSNVNARFNWLNPLNNYVLQQPNNGFQKGDAVCIENQQFVLASAQNVGKFVGTVLQNGPGPDQFILRPANGIIDFVPGLPGVVGDYLYPSIDGSGDLTLDDASRRPVFMKIAMQIPSFTIGSNPNPAGNAGDIYQINGYNVGPISSNYNVTTAASEINALTNLHKVTADVVAYRTENQTNNSLCKLGFPISIRASGVSSMSAIINGVTVTFSSYIYGNVNGDTNAQYPADWAKDINNANIPNVVATTDGGTTQAFIKLTHLTGGAINITNVTSDANSTPFAGANSCSGLQLSIPANTSQTTLRLRRDDGGPINLVDISGNFLLFACGLLSGQNGRYALGLNIEQGLRSSNTNVVANITARNALYPLVGDQAYVINSDDGNGNYVNQWSIWLWNGSTWTLMSRQSSSTVAAKTLEYSLTTSSPASFNIGNIVSGTRVTVVTVEVLTAFTTSSLLELGYSVANPTSPEANTSGLMSSTLIDLSKTGIYATTGDILFGSETATGDVTLTGTFILGGSPTGSARILVSYV